MSNSVDDQEVDLAMRCAVGGAIFSWSRLENVLAKTFNLTIGNSAAYSILGCIRAFEARLSIVNASITQTFGGSNDDIIEKWRALSAHISKISKNRNMIAHSHQIAPGKIQPYFDWSKVFDYDPNAFLSVSDVESFANDFAQATGALLALNDHIRYHVDLSRGGGEGAELWYKNAIGFHKQGHDLLDQLVHDKAQNRAKHGRPPQSSRQ
ncbi:MAG: hypothetical protein KYX69_11765 [Sphingomonas sp.]|uniref:hypothetical protein n=1 Tax=Sphingomonas sp. TaxID=28214 RepID=UPI00260EEA36|nr:hypothetical protein [Sphingomonas sp.]MDK2768383.1 hypothetical protein [Sphingomonas sp.]